MYNGHLSIEEIEQLIRQKGPAEDQTHVDNCMQCRSLLEDCQAVSAKLDKLASVPIGAETAMNCPDERIWFYVSGGTLSEAESLRYVQHAAECPACSQKLKTAIRMFEEDLSPEEEQALAELPGSAPNAQRKLAHDLGATKTENLQKQTETITDKRSGSISWRWLSWSAATAGLAVAVFSSLAVYRQLELPRVEQAVADAYNNGRPTEYRVAGVKYSNPVANRGRLQPSRITVPEWFNRPILRARAAFLARDWSVATAALEKARGSGNNSAEVLNNLVVAYALQAESPRDDNLYRKALALSNDVIQRYPSDPIVYFNRGLIFEQLASEEPGRRDDAILSFEKFIEMEPDPRWTAEASAKLQLLR